MSLLPLWDNPLFIKSWRERLKPQYLVSALLIAGFIITLILIGNYLNRDSLTVWDNVERTSVPVDWLRNALYQVACLQGVALLLIGTLSAYKNAAAERVGGTIEFHRASPIPRLDQAIGLIVGGAVLEWVVFAAIAVVAAIIAGCARVGSAPIASFYFSIALTAFFLHSFGVWLGLYTAPRKFGGVFGGIAVMYVLWMVITAALYAVSENSAFYHSTWLPAYGALHYDLLGLRDPMGMRGSWHGSSGSDAVEAVLYGIKMPSLLLQILVQLPLGLLAVTGIRRRFASGERSFLSKTQFLALYLVIIFFYVSSLITSVTQPDHRYVQNQMTLLTICWVYVAMFFGVIAATPEYLEYSKGLTRMRKSGLKISDPSADQSSNVFWLFVFCVTTAVFWLIHMRIVHAPVIAAALVLAVLIAQIVAFAGTVEAFRLSRFHQKRIYFATGLAICWIGIPVLGLVTAPLFHSNEIYQALFFAPSPFFSGPVMGTLSYQGHVPPVEVWKLCVLLCVNTGIAIVSSMAAFSQRQRMRREILDT